MTPATAMTTGHRSIVAALDAGTRAARSTSPALARWRRSSAWCATHNLGRRVLHLEYEAYEPLARRGLDLIVEEAREHWPAVRMMIHHRIGRMEIGEASVAIAAASPHRADAFAAARYAIERIKQIVPIWKHEYFEGGDVWIEGATADPDNVEAREKAMRIACA